MASSRQGIQSKGEKTPIRINCNIWRWQWLKVGRNGWMVHCPWPISQVAVALIDGSGSRGLYITRLLWWSPLFNRNWRWNETVDHRYNIQSWTSRTFLDLSHFSSGTLMAMWAWVPGAMLRPLPSFQTCWGRNNNSWPAYYQFLQAFHQQTMVSNRQLLTFYHEGYFHFAIDW